MPRSGGVDDDVDPAERRGRLVEQSLDVELVGDVGAHGERRAVGGEDLLDRRLGVALVADVDHDDGVAAARERPGDLAADPARAAGDDRHRLVGGRVVALCDHARTVVADRARSHPGIHGRASLVVYACCRHGRAPSAGVAGPSRRARGCSTGCWRTSAAARAPCWSSAARRASARPRFCTTAPGRRPGSASRGSPASSPRWSCRSRGCISSARRCSTGSTRCRSRSRPRCASRWACRPAPLPTASSSPWPRSACWPRSPRSGRCCASSTTPSGSMPPRRQVLGFVARRLLAESVAIVFAVARADRRARARRPARARARRARTRRTRAPCSRRSSRAGSTSASATGSSPRRAATRWRSWSCRAGWPRRSCPAGSGCRRPQALPRRIEESFLRRLDALPEDARLLLLVAAAEPVDDPLLVWRAAERLGIESRGGRDETEGLLAIGERVTFLHPLVRSAVYRSASAQERRAVHLRPGGGDRRRGRRGPSRLASRRRRVGARTRRSPSELERSAGRAQARGGLAAAAAFLQRSVALTLDPARRADRALAAAQASLHAGAFDAALALLGAAEAGAARRARARPRRPAARRDRLRPEPRQRRAAAAAAGAATRLEPLDVRPRARHLSRRVERRAVRRAPGQRRQPARRLAARCAPPPPPRPARGRPTLLLDGFALRVHRRARRRRTARCSRRATGVRRARRLGRGGAALGLAGHGGARSRCGTSTPASRWPTAASSSPGAPARSSVLAVARQRARPGCRARRRLRPRGAAGRRGRRGHRGHRATGRAVRRARARRPSTVGRPRPPS